MSIHTILSQMENNLIESGVAVRNPKIKSGRVTIKGTRLEVSELFYAFATRIVEEAKKEERERIQQKLQELWSKDPRSVEGKKQGNTDAWMMGYRTAQKEISLTLAPSYRR